MKHNHLAVLCIFLLSMVLAQSSSDFSAVGLRVMLTGHTSGVTVAFSPDGRTLATGDTTTVRIWNVSSGQEIRKFTVPRSVWSVAFSPDGRTLATGGDTTVWIWDVSNGQKIMELTGHTNFVRSVAFSPDGRTLATSSYDNTARIWNVSSGQEIMQFMGHTSSVNSVAFSPDGRTLATGSGDNTARIWNVSSGQEIMKFMGHTRSVYSVTFSPDGRTLATGSDDNTARIWNISTGQEIMKLTGHTDRVDSVAFSPDGRTLATTSPDGTTRLWNASSGKEINRLSGGGFAVAFSLEGTRVASGSFGTARIYGTPDLLPIFNVNKPLQPQLGDLIITAPSNARIIINNQTGSNTQRLAAGSYTVTITQDGYKPFTQTVTVSVDQTTRVTATLEPLPQNLTIFTNTPNATITQNGQTLGRTDSSGNLTLPNLKPDTYNFTITATGFDTQTISVTIPVGSPATARVTLQASTGTLSIRSNNDNATITINGDSRGTTRDFALPAGTYTIVISANGFKPQTQTVTIQSGQTANLTFNLVANDGTLSIRSNNETANITINGDARGFTGATRDFALPVGTYTVIVSASGFATSTQTITIRSDTRAELIFNLEPLPQMLRVVTGIPNATVSLNGRDIGTTDANGNLEIPNLAPNTYQVSVTATGFKPNTRTATVPIGSRGTVTIPLEKALADVTISSNANNATVTIASRVIGLAPAKVSNLEPGTYSVTVSASGYEPSTQSITVKAGDSSSITVNLKALPVDLRIVSNASNAQVSINGATPKDIPKDGLVLSLEPNQTYTVLVTAVGYNQNKQSVTLEPNKPIRLQVDLKAQPSSLLIRSTPSGASVLRDGVSLGATMLNLRDLEPGIYSFTVTAPNFEPQTIQVTVVAGQNQRVDVTLKPVAQTVTPTTPVSSPTPITAPTPTAPITAPVSSPTPTAPTNPVSSNPNLNIIKPREDMVALVIGNGAYTDGIAPLPKAITDAKRFADALRNPKIGNLLPANVEILENATKSRLENALRRLAGKASNGQTVLFYYAGHGLPTKTGEPAILPTDAEIIDLDNSMISLSKVQELLSSAKKVLLILDSCFSGTQDGNRSFAPSGRPFVAVVVPATTASIAVLSATSKNEVSNEDNTGGFFTSALLEGMSGVADTNRDGIVSLTELATFVASKVRVSSGRKQNPQLTGSLEVTLAQNPEVLAVQSLDARVARIRTLYDANKITIDQTEQLIKLIRTKTEFPDLKAFLDGSLLEDSFLNRMSEGLYARFGIGGGKP